MEFRYHCFSFLYKYILKRIVNSVFVLIKGSKFGSNESNESIYLFIYFTDFRDKK